jgi:hypothetical protein
VKGGKISYLAAGTPGTDELYKSLANFSQIINTKLEGSKTSPITLLIR